MRMANSTTSNDRSLSGSYLSGGWDLFVTVSYTIAMIISIFADGIVWYGLRSNRQLSVFMKRLFLNRSLEDMVAAIGIIPYVFLLGDFQESVVAKVFLC